MDAQVFSIFFFFFFPAVVVVVVGLSFLDVVGIITRYFHCTENGTFFFLSIGPKKARVWLPAGRSVRYLTEKREKHACNNRLDGTAWRSIPLSGHLQRFTTLMNWKSMRNYLLHQTTSPSVSVQRRPSVRPPAPWESRYIAIAYMEMRIHALTPPNKTDAQQVKFLFKSNDMIDRPKHENKYRFDLVMASS
jgi:hypothetical protein